MNCGVPLNQDRPLGITGYFHMGRSVRPDATGKQLRHSLLSTALELGDPDLGAGMIDHDGFLNCVNVLALSTDLPTQASMQAPSEQPTMAPMQGPTTEPIEAPTEAPMPDPTAAPTGTPNSEPLRHPQRNRIQLPRQFSWEAPPSHQPPSD